MQVLVLGASGRTGRRIAAQLVARGDRVVSLGRCDPDLAGVRHIAGVPDDAQALRAALDDCDAVVSALASSNRDAVCSAATAALIGSGLSPRFVVVGGAGVDVPGDRKGAADKVVGVVMRLVAGRMLADRTREWQMLEASSLPYTFLRPPRLTDKPATGRWRVTFDRPASMEIAREDLAGAAVEALGRGDLARRSPFVAGGAA
jgi:putative NADH-flavin reductase